MNAIFLATNLSDTVRETGEAFGWDPKLFFSQVISFIIVAYVVETLRLQTDSQCAPATSSSKLRKRI